MSPGGPDSDTEPERGPDVAVNIIIYAVLKDIELTSNKTIRQSHTFSSQQEMSFTTHSLRRVCVRTFSTPNSRAFSPHSSFLNTATQIRNMATGRNREWLCILPDKANVLERRKEVKG